jgi:hypothetical protein
MSFGTTAAQRDEKSGPPNAFRQQLEAFWKVLGIEPAEFHPVCQDDDRYRFEVKGFAYPKDIDIAHATLFRLYKLKIDLSINIARKLTARLQTFLNEAIEKARLAHSLDELVDSLIKGHFAFLREEKDGLTVDVFELCRFYDLVRAGVVKPRTGTDEMPDAESRVLVEITFRGELDKGLLTKSIQEDRYRIFTVKKLCTQITLDLSAADAKRIHELFTDGALSREGVIALRMVHGVSPPEASSVEWINPGAAAVGDQIDKALRRATLRESLKQPWRRLAGIFSPAVRYSQMRHLIEHSEERAYAASKSADNCRALRTDVVACWILWPLAAGSAALCVLSLLRLLGANVSPELGVATGVALGWMGGQVCGSVVSPMSCAAGTVIMALAFATAQSFAFGKFGSVMELIQRSPGNDAFTTVAGGILGLAAPVWRTFLSPAGGCGLLALVAAAIAGSGWLMAQPRAARVQDQPISRKSEIVGALAGSAAGFLIGAVLGLTQLLEHFGVADVTAFSSAFALLGSVTFAGTVWLRLRSDPGGRSRTTKTMILFGAAHAIVTLFLLTLAFGFPDHLIGAIGLAATTGWFHATWFTAAFLVGATVGSTRSAVIATTIEGAVGFTVFVLIRALG